MSVSGTSGKSGASDVAEKLQYDVLRESSIAKRFTQEEIRKLQEEGLQINFDDDDKAAEEEDEDAQKTLQEEDAERRAFYENLLNSPYPQMDGKFSDCIAFKDRCSLMDPVANAKGRIYKSIIRPTSSKAAKQVTEEDAVLFHMNAFLIEAFDEPFDSSYARKRPLLSKLDRLLKGYALSLLSMKVGELSEFAIHRSLAYGEFGCPPRIPAASDILVILEVLNVFTKGTIEYYHSMSRYEVDKEASQEQILEFAAEDRATGSSLYREGEYRQAVYYYRRAIDLVERNFANKLLEDEHNQLLLTLYHNAAACQIKLDHGPSIVNYARRAILIDPESPKANYQLGRGYLKLNRLERARIFLMKAKKSRPNDPDINEAIEVLNQKVTAENMTTKDMYARMAGGISGEGAPPKEGEQLAIGTGEGEDVAAEAGAEAPPGLESLFAAVDLGWKAVPENNEDEEEENNSKEAKE